MGLLSKGLKAAIKAGRSASDAKYTKPKKDINPLIKQTEEVFKSPDQINISKDYFGNEQEPNEQIIGRLYSPVYSAIEEMPISKEGTKGQNISAYLNKRAPNVDKSELESFDINLDPNKKYTREEVLALAKEKGTTDYTIEKQKYTEYDDMQRQNVADPEEEYVELTLQGKQNYTRDRLESQVHFGGRKNIGHTRSSIRREVPEGDPLTQKIKNDSRYLLVEEMQSDLAKIRDDLDKKDSSTADFFGEGDFEELYQDTVIDQFTNLKNTLDTNYDIFLNQNVLDTIEDFYLGTLDPENITSLKDIEDVFSNRNFKVNLETQLMDEGVYAQGKDLDTLALDAIRKSSNITDEIAEEEIKNFFIDFRKNITTLYQNSIKNINIQKLPVATRSEYVKKLLLANIAYAKQNNINKIVIPNYKEIARQRTDTIATVLYDRASNDPFRKKYENALAKGTADQVAQEYFEDVFKPVYQDAVKKVLNTLKKETKNAIKTKPKELKYPDLTQPSGFRTSNALEIDITELDYNPKTNAFRFNEGGVVNSKQGVTPMLKQQMELFRRGGLNDEGGEIDEVSGNEVPIGGTKKGVRDDVPAMVSEGEFVFPEDVVRYIGLDKLMQLRQQAKMGLKKMEAMGQMGNGDEATIPDDLPFDMADLIIVAGDTGEELEMQEGGFVTRPTTVRRTAQQPTYAQPPVATLPPEQPVFRSVRPLTPAIQRPAPSVIDFDKLMGDANINFKEYRNAEGKTLLVPFLGNSPIFPIPDGYTLYVPSTEDDQTEDTETVEEVNETLANISVKEPNRSNRDDIVRNEFTEAGSWDAAPLDMYIKEARKFTNGTSSVATGIAGALSSPLGLFMYGATAHQKKRILATIDKRIQEARGTPVAGQVAELQKIKGILEGTIKPDSILNKITSTISKIFAPDEVKQKTANTAVASTVGATGAVEESLRPRARPTDIQPTEQYESTAAQMQAMQFDPFAAIGPIEEVAARDALMPTDTPVQTGVPVENLTPLLARLTSQGQSFKTGLPEGIKRRYLDTDESGNLIFGQRGKDQIVSDYGIDAVREAESQVLPSILDRTAKLGLSATYDPYFFDRPTAYPEVGQRDLSQISEAPDIRRQLASAYQTPSVVTPRSVQDRGFVPSNIAQPAAIAETIAPTPTRADYDISQLPPVQQPRVSPRLGYESGQDVLQSVAPYISSTIGQPSVSQIDYSDIQTSGPPSVPDAMRTPLGTAAAASAREQQATLPQPYDPSIDDLVRQTREALGTSGQTVEETVARAQEAMGKQPEPLRIKITEGTVSPSPFVKAAKSIAELGRPTAAIDQRIDVSRQPIIEAPYPTQPATALPAAPSYATMDMGEAGRTSIVPPTVASVQDPYGIGTAGEFAGTPTLSIPTDPRLDLPVGTIPAESLAPDVSLRPKARPTTFSDAFAAARAAGQKTFSFGGKEYTTELAEEKPAKAPAADKPKSGLDFNPATSEFKTKYERDEALAGNLGSTAAYKATMEVHKQGLAAKGISDKKDKPAATTTKPAATTTTRSKEDVQKDINAALKKSGGEWTSELNTLVKERDVAPPAPKPKAKKDSGGGGDKDSGGGGGGCVIATHGISTGGFSALDKAKAEIWCERTYHGKWYGEAFRRGYRYAGNKAIQKGKAEKHYQEFKDFVAYGRGIKKDWKSKINYYKRTIQFFLTGLIIKEDV